MHIFNFLVQKYNTQYKTCLEIFFQRQSNCMEADATICWGLRIQTFSLTCTNIPPTLDQYNPANYKWWFRNSGQETANCTCTIHLPCQCASPVLRKRRACTASLYTALQKSPGWLQPLEAELLRPGSTWTTVSTQKPWSTIIMLFPVLHWRSTKVCITLAYYNAEAIHMHPIGSTRTDLSHRAVWFLVWFV